MRLRTIARLTGTAATAAGCVLAARSRSLRWGATAAEAGDVVAGDELLAAANLVSTRAISVRAPAEAVWPWIAQLGQGRGGFYSYDFVENLIGCDIHSADHVEPAWQDVAVGDEVRLHPDIALRVALVEPGRSVVLRGAVPLGNSAAPYDFTWAFTLRDGPDGTTRLVVRERYSYSRWWAPLLVEPVEGVSFVMSQKMLRGIRDRAERATAGAAGSTPDVRLG